MKTDPSLLTGAESGELTGLISKALRRGKPDVFQGRRRWVRYYLGMRIELAAADPERDETWTGVMHNISGGGIGFWSKRPMPARTRFRFRDLSEGESAVWIAAHVTHCTLGIGGYLIGARFENPRLPDAESDAGGSADASAAEVASRPVAFAPLRSLRTRLAVAGGIAGAAGGLAAGVSCFLCLAVAPYGSLLAALTALGVAVPLGSLAGWWLAGPETRFLAGLRTVLVRIARDTPPVPPAEEPPSKEMAALQDAVADLCTMWPKFHDNERAHREKIEELNQVKSNILSIVSRDLRAPLTSIQLYTQRLKDELTTLIQADQNRFLDGISDECRRLSRLVDDLLEAQRLDSGRCRWDLQSRDLAETILRAARPFEPIAENKSITFTVDCPPSLPPVQADADKIAQVVNNLLSNAFKYTPPGGTICLSAQAGNSQILIRVADTGPGIPRNQWDQVFDRFTQLADPNLREMAGVGLGLYIVRQIVERHGGAVWVDSEVGHGSEFCVSLPLRDSEPIPEPDDASSPGRHILVCDADPELAAAIAQTLRGDACEVRVAHSGCRLLAQLSQWETHVVVTDVLLPDMDATELLDALSHMPRRSFRLVVHSYVDDGPELRRRGVDVFVRRPATREEIREAVRVALRKKSTDTRTVVLVETGTADWTKFSRLLSADGHVPVVARSLPEAAGIIRGCAADVVLVPADALTGDWSNLTALCGPGRGGVRVIVIGEKPSKAPRRLAGQRGVTLLPYRPGNEEVVVEALRNCQEVLEPALPQ